MKRTGHTMLRVYLLLPISSSILKTTVLFFHFVCARVESLHLLLPMMERLVVNGWSPSKRNNPFANSGIVVNMEEKDWQAWSKHGPLAAMYFQSSIEQKAFELGGGSVQSTGAKDD